MIAEQIPQWAAHKTTSETYPYIILSPVSNQVCWNRSEDLGEDLAILSRRIIPQVESLVRNWIGDTLVFWIIGFVFVGVWSGPHERGGLPVRFMTPLRCEQAKVF